MRITVLPLTSCALACVLAACAAPPQATTQPPRIAGPAWSASDHLAFAAEGPHQLLGQAFLRQRGGGVVTCAGTKVMALPDTGYFRALIINVRAGHAVSQDELEQARAARVVRSTTCDASGRYAFERMPAGDWHVISMVTWTTLRTNEGGALIGRTTTPQSAPLLLSNAHLTR